MLAWRTAYQMNSRGEKQREKQQLFGKAIIQCFPKLESHRSDRSHYVADFSTALLDRSSMQKPDGILISADTLLYGSRPDYSRSTSDSIWKYRLGASMCRKGVALSVLLTKQSEHSSRGIVLIAPVSGTTTGPPGLLARLNQRQPGRRAAQSKKATHESGLVQ